MTKQEFLAAVQQEAAALRDYAQPHELQQLNIQTFLPRLYSECIYGQMTGDCFSSRAAELIHKCCPIFFRDMYDDKPLDEAVPLYSEVKAYGMCDKDDLYDRRDNYEFYSAIEAYIVLEDARNAELIAYLKGETETFEP